jgi:hypothetical protein
MIYDMRTYTCRPGTIKKHMQIYVDNGWNVQKKHLGDPVVYGQTETGNVNSYTHIWAYKDAADRATKRAAMQADPEWLEFLKLSAEAGYLVNQENRILVATDFFQALKNKG